MDWNKRWEQENTPWDLRTIHPHLPILLEQLGTRLAKQSTFYVPGCGHGHDASFLSDQGYHVLASDISKTAVELATKRYGQKVQFSQGDVLKTPHKERGFFDAIYDHAMLCALYPEQQKKYVNACVDRLKPKSFWLGIPFTELKIAVENGPPFAISVSQLHDLFADQFEILYQQIRRDMPGPPPVKEVCLWIAQKKY